MHTHVHNAISVLMFMVLCILVLKHYIKKLILFWFIVLGRFFNECFFISSKQEPRFWFQSYILTSVLKLHWLKILNNVSELNRNGFTVIVCAMSTTSHVIRKKFGTQFTKISSSSTNINKWLVPFHCFFLLVFTAVESDYLRRSHWQY